MLVALALPEVPGSTDTWQSQVMQFNNSAVIESDIQHRTGPKRSQLDFLWPVRWCFSQVTLEDSKHFCGIKVPEKFVLLYSSTLFFKLWELPVLVQPTFPWWHYRVLRLLWLSQHLDPHDIFYGRQSCHCNPRFMFKATKSLSKVVSPHSGSCCLSVLGVPKPFSQMLCGGQKLSPEREIWAHSIWI